MTKKNKIMVPILIMLISALILSSCGTGTTDRMTVDEKSAIEDYVMSSYFMLRGDAELPESRAAWDYTETVELPAAGQTKSATSNNYPEKGQKTTVTISKEASFPAEVYKVVNVTEYPRRDSITSTTESYYINDNTSSSDAAPDGIYDVRVDPICDVNGSTDPLARIEFTTVFDNGTEREETIYAVYPTVEFAEFDVDGPLVFPNADDSGTLGGGTFNEAGDEWSPGNGTADWSSVVRYEQEIDESNYFWSKTSRIIGTRYYTEQGDIRTSVTYERTISVQEDNEDLGVIGDFLKKLFNRRNTETVSTEEGTTYTETVIRTRIEGSKKTEINSQSNVYDEAGASVVTFRANYETADDGTVLQSGLPVATYY